MDKNFGGVIWTDHAVERRRGRGIKQGDAWATFRRPQVSKYARRKGAYVYYRTTGNETIKVVATKNEDKQWVILSVWSAPKHRSISTKTKDSLLKKLVRYLRSKRM